MMSHKGQTGPSLEQPIPTQSNEGKSPSKNGQETRSSTPSMPRKRERSHSTPLTSHPRRKLAQPRLSYPTIHSAVNSPSLIGGPGQPVSLCVKLVTVGSSKPHSVHIRDDTGTEPNWVHPTIVDRRGLRLVKCEAKRFRDWHNRGFECTEFVQVRWVDKNNRTHDGKFYVTAPECDVELVLGNEFVTRHGRASDWATEETIGTARILTQDKRSESEKKTIEKRRAANDKDASELDKLRQSSSSSRRSGTAPQSRKKEESSSKPH